MKDLCHEGVRRAYARGRDRWSALYIVSPHLDWRQAQFGEKQQLIVILNFSKIPDKNAYEN